MTAFFLHNWNSKEDMIADFEGVYNKDRLTPEQIAKYDHVDVILASYGTDNYSGYAFVLFRNKNNGKLYENHGNHCSCYGLENQWGEELCDIDSLKHRVTKGSLGSDDWSDNVFKNEIRQVIQELEVAEIEAFQMPEWASGHACGMYTALHAALPTKDGRRCSNAVMVGLSDRQWEQAPTTYKVVTDAGSILLVNENELKELFHPPEYLMKTLLPAHIKALEMEPYS